MNEIVKIVVPVDLGKNTQILADYALYIGKKLDAHVTFVHVTEFFETGDMMLGSPSFSGINEERFSKAKELMGNLIQDNSQQHEKIGGTVLKGDTVDTIVRFAEEEKADLLIIGTHGAKGLEKILLGSVAERVLKRVHCPTLTMNPYKV